MERYIFPIICLIILFGCKSKTTEIPNADNGIAFWSDDSIVACCPDLVMLIEPLYQFQPSDSLGKDLLFMSETRKRFCAYYDSVGMWKASDDEYAKVDSVINYINRIYESRANSSADMMIAADVSYRVDRLRHYGLFQQFIGHRNAAYYHLQEEEWWAWDTLEKAVSTIVSGLVDIQYANASGWSSGMTRINGYSRIANAHMSLYERDLTLYSFLDSSDGYTVVGSYQTPAKQFLISCCKEAVKNVSGEHNTKMFNETKGKIDKAIASLPTLIDRWVSARNAWTEEICCDATRDLFVFSTAQALIDMGVVVSTSL